MPGASTTGPRSGSWQRARRAGYSGGVAGPAVRTELVTASKGEGRYGRLAGRLGRRGRRGRACCRGRFGRRRGGRDHAERLADQPPVVDARGALAKGLLDARRLQRLVELVGTPGKAFLDARVDELGDLTALVEQRCARHQPAGRSRPRRTRHRRRQSARLRQTGWCPPASGRPSRVGPRPRRRPRGQPRDPAPRGKRARRVADGDDREGRGAASPWGISTGPPSLTPLC